MAGAAFSLRDPWGQTMTVVRADWTSANRFSAQQSGPELYAPQGRRAPEPPRSGVDAVPQRSEEPGLSNAPAGEHLDSLIRRIAAASMDDIDSVNRELDGIRDVLRMEGERVSREIDGYVRLSQASMAAMRLISERIKQWKDTRY
jgi:hypothetical protein